MGNAIGVGSDQASVSQQDLSVDGKSSDEKNTQIRRPVHRLYPKRSRKSITSSLIESIYSGNLAETIGDNESGAVSKRTSESSGATAEEDLLRSIGKEAITPKNQISQLAPYLPLYLINDIANQSPEFQTRCFKGAILFIDISGFTPLTERFSKEGTAACEHFLEVANSYFTQILDIVSLHHGDVECFAGDALLIIFDAERLSAKGLGKDTMASSFMDTMEREEEEVEFCRFLPPLTAAVCFALKCAEQLISRLSPFEVPGINDLSLSLHGAVGVGEMISVITGGTLFGSIQCWRSFICGPVMEQIAKAHDLSGKHEIVVTKEVLGMVKDISSFVSPCGKECATLNVPTADLAKEHIDTSNDPQEAPILGGPHSRQASPKHTQEFLEEYSWLWANRPTPGSPDVSASMEEELLPMLGPGLVPNLHHPPPVFIPNASSDLFLSTDYTPNFTPNKGMWEPSEELPTLKNRTSGSKKRRSSIFQSFKKQSASGIESVKRSLKKSGTTPPKLGSLTSSVLQRSPPSPGGGAFKDMNWSEDFSDINEIGKDDPFRDVAKFRLNRYSTESPQPWGLSRLDSFFGNGPILTMQDLTERIELMVPEEIKRYLQRMHMVIPKTVAGKVAAGQSSWLGELRLAHVAFVNFQISGLAGKKLPKDSLLTNLNSAIRRCFEIISKYGGFIRQLTMDDKGLVLIYTFGTPGASFDDNILRSLTTAVEMRAGVLSGERIDLRIGISTGDVCCGVVGSSALRCEYSIFGDTVNLAARLSAAASKGHHPVLCCPRTAKGLAKKKKNLHAINVEEAFSFRPKGKSEDILLYSVTKRENEVENVAEFTFSEEEGATMLGRAEELKTLKKAFQPNSRSTVCCVVEGELGIGKSALLHKYMTECKQEDFDLIRISAVDRSTPYYAMGQIFKVILSKMVDTADEAPKVRILTPTSGQRKMLIQKSFRDFVATPVSDRFKRLVKWSPKTSSAIEEGIRKKQEQEQINQQCAAEKEVREFLSKERDSFVSLNLDNNTLLDGTPIQWDSTPEQSEEESKATPAQPPCAPSPIVSVSHSSGLSPKSTFTGAGGYSSPYNPNKFYSTQPSLQVGGGGEESGVEEGYSWSPNTNSIHALSPPRKITRGRSNRAFGLNVNTSRSNSATESMTGTKSASSITPFMLTDRLRHVSRALTSAQRKKMRLLKVFGVQVKQMSWEYGMEESPQAGWDPLKIFDDLKDVTVSIINAIIKARGEDQPNLFIFVEDIHYLDLGSFELLVHMMEHCREGISFLCSSLPPSSYGKLYTMNSYHRLLGLECCSKIQVLPLDVDYARNLCCKYLGVEEIEEILFHRINKKCSGNPLFIQEACTSFLGDDQIIVVQRRMKGKIMNVATANKRHSLAYQPSLTKLDPGAIADKDFRNKSFSNLLYRSKERSRRVSSIALDREPGATRESFIGRTSSLRSRASVTDDVLPAAMQTIAVARIDSLEAHLALVLKVAAVIGEKFKISELIEIYPVEEQIPELTNHLETLCQRHLLTSLKAGTYIFQHEYLYQTAYQMLLHTHRRKLHRKVAIVMEMQCPDELPKILGHWREVVSTKPNQEELEDLGGDGEWIECVHKTIKCVLKASKYYVSWGIVDESINILRWAMDLLEDYIPESFSRDKAEFDLCLEAFEVLAITNDSNEERRRYKQRSEQLIQLPHLHQEKATYLRRKKTAANLAPLRNSASTKHILKSNDDLKKSSINEQLQLFSNINLVVEYQNSRVSTALHRMKRRMRNCSTKPQENPTMPLLTFQGFKAVLAAVHGNLHRYFESMGIFTSRVSSLIADGLLSQIVSPLSQILLFSIGMHEFAYAIQLMKLFHFDEPENHKALYENCPAKSIRKKLEFTLGSLKLYQQIMSARRRSTTPLNFTAIQQLKKLVSSASKRCTKAHFSVVFKLAALMGNVEMMEKVLVRWRNKTTKIPTLFDPLYTAAEGLYQLKVHVPEGQFPLRKEALTKSYMSGVQLLFRSLTESQEKGLILFEVQIAITISDILLQLGEVHRAYRLMGFSMQHVITSQDNPFSRGLPTLQLNTYIDGWRVWKMTEKLSTNRHLASTDILRPPSPPTERSFSKDSHNNNGSRRTVSTDAFFMFNRHVSTSSHTLTRNDKRASIGTNTTDDTGINSQVSSKTLEWFQKGMQGIHSARNRMSVSADNVSIPSNARLNYPAKMTFEEIFGNI